MFNVLFVDDDPAGAEAVSLYLRHSGFQVTTARNGPDALNALTSATMPSLILLDVRMPEMDGLEFLGILRSYLRWQHIPVILLTAYADLPGVTHAAKRYGADIMNKAGIDLAELVKLIRDRVGDSPHLDSSNFNRSHLTTH